jgi:hypothetical protein
VELNDVLIVLGLLLAGILFFLLRWFVRALARQCSDRWQPPRGSRPNVRIQVEGVIYDLTDDLVRVADIEQGMATWFVVGPPHLRLPHDGTLDSEVAVLPEMTEVLFPLVSLGEDTLRFMTAQEITATHQQYQDPH